MDAAAGGRLADGGLVAGAVDVDVASVGIHVAAAVESGLEAVQPQNARGDFGIGQAFPGVTNWLAGFERGSGRPAAADFFGDAVQAERGAIGAFRLADAEARSGAAELFYELIFTAETRRRRGSFEKRNDLPADFNRK